MNSFSRKMRWWPVLWAASCLMASSSFGAGPGTDIHYVDRNSSDPRVPYTNWSNAAWSIQEAINAADPGDTVLVNDGSYDNGGWPDVLCQYRIGLNKAVTVRSVNGPAFTFIVGQGPVGVKGIRCAFVTNSAQLVGFTLTNGYTKSFWDTGSPQNGGGAYCEPRGIISNCVITCNCADDECGGAGGGVFGGIVKNCIISGNKADVGGGASSSLAENCAIIGNRATRGGGAFAVVMTNCTLIGNYARQEGGSLQSRAVNSIVYHNDADDRNPNYDPAKSVFTDSCTTPMPSSPSTDNLTAEPGIVSRSNPHLVEGAACIDAGRQAYAPRSLDIDLERRTNGTVDIGCDEFWPTNISGELSVAISASTTNTVTGRDIVFTAEIEGKANRYVWEWGDGQFTTNAHNPQHAYAAPGVYTVTLTATNTDHSASAAVTVSICSGYTNYVSKAGIHAAPPYTNWATAAATIQDAIGANIDGGVVVVAEGVYDSGTHFQHQMANRVVLYKQVTVIASNSDPRLTVIKGAPNVRCAYVTNGASLVGFTLRDGRTPSAGDVIWEASGGGAWCERGGVLSNCVITNNWAYNGGGVYGGILQKCLVMWNIAGNNGGGVSAGALHGCNVSSNTAGMHGGGVCESKLRDCFVVGNSATNDGGGAYYCNLTNCLVIRNYAGSEGGGVRNGSVESCTIATNSAGVSGGGVVGGDVLGGDVLNSIVYFNQAPDGTNNYGGTRTIKYSCTYPTASGEENTTNDPLFVNMAGNDFHLQSASPCINAGDNAPPWLHDATDLSGDLPRLIDTVEMGAYECLPTDQPWINIISEYGTPLPLRAGLHTCASNTTLTITISPPCITNGWTLYVASGSTVVGNTSTTVNATNVTLTITNNATLTWNWTTNYWLTCSAGSNGSINQTSQWVPLGSNVAITATPSNYYYLSAWTGDTNNCPTADNGITAQMDYPRAILVSFSPYLATNDTPHWWLARHGLDPNSAGAFYDDGDGIPAWQEYIADTDPTNKDSVLALTGLTLNADGSILIEWKGGQMATQYIETRRDLGSTNEAWNTI